MHTVAMTVDTNLSDKFVSLLGLVHEIESKSLNAVANLEEKARDDRSFQIAQLGFPSSARSLVYPTARDHF